MRLLLTSNASYDPPRGGSTRSNLVWLRQLAHSGHVCRVVSAALGQDSESVVEGIRIRGVAQLTRRANLLTEEIRQFQPDFVLVSSEDISQVLLHEAARAAPDRLVYLAHTPQFYPFGPESWHPDPQAAEIVRSARSVVAIGHHMAAYIDEHLGVKAAVIHPPIYGHPSPAESSERDWVLMINPCQVKGLAIFLELARRFPQLAFAALAGWGTTTADRESLARLPNVKLLESVSNIDEVLSRARVLLMPSLWYEGFGLIAMEAMLRGIPVISSDSGGLAEAKQGTGFVIPVRRIQRYLPEFDETNMPRPVVPEQNLTPWVEALRSLVSDPDVYASESERSRAVALQFVSTLDASDLEKHLLKPAPLRILLAHNSLYYPAHGGGDKSNRLLMEALAVRGHQVRVIARRKSGEENFRLNGVDVYTLPLNASLRNSLIEQMNLFDPNVILTSTDDPALLLFDSARTAQRARLVYLVRATIAVPFGPDSSMPSAAKTEALRSADGIVGVSEYVARYVRKRGKLDAVHVPISLMEPGEWPDVGRFDNPYVVMVNPCAVKGIDIFLALARRMPGLRFAAVPTWGTNAADLANLQNEPNIDVLPAVDDIDEILRQARVVLVPSLWAEARSRIVVEAMLRGVPVIASDAGGINEAKLGVPYLVRVNLIEHYQPALDENMVPVADVPPQNVDPWQSALERLTSDRAHWDEIAKQSRDAALRYAQGLNVEPFESFLTELLKRPKRPPALSDDRRKLLALRLQRRATWFPTLGKAQMRLFCFPHAGAGVLAFRSWADKIPGVAVVPVLLPGRETRAAERPFDDMEALIEALTAAIRPHLDVPFAFFGHSMGAGIAFELARSLRRNGLPEPRALIVSAARAPRYRLGRTSTPDPSDEDLTRELQQLGSNAEAIRLALPLLRADTRLYRNYAYRAEPPLATPIAAYGGESDLQVRPEHLEGWREETIKSFKRREFPGGHFFFQNEPKVLEAIAGDIEGWQ